MLFLSFSVALSSQALSSFCCSIARELRNQTLTLELSAVATALCPDNLLPLASSLALCRSDFLSPLSIDLSFSLQIYSSRAPLLSQWSDFVSGSLYFAGFFRLSVRFSGKIQNSWLWVCVFCFDCFSAFFFFFFVWLVAIFVQNPWLLLLMLLICEMGILELICVQLNN